MVEIEEGCSMATQPIDQTELRDRALKHLKKRRDLFAHALIYLMVNSFLVAIWAMTSHGGFFWPIFPMVGWGIGLVMNVWDVYRGDEFDEESIKREMDRLAH
jgi:hypothetical protein